MSKGLHPTSTTVWGEKENEVLRGKKPQGIWDETTMETISKQASGYGPAGRSRRLCSRRREAVVRCERRENPILEGNAGLHDQAKFFGLGVIPVNSRHHDRLSVKAG